MTIYTPNPDNSPNALTIVDDSPAPNATELNTPVEGTADMAANLRALVGSSLAANWGAPAAPGTGVVDAVYCWDPCAQRWLCAANESGTQVISSSHDSGKSWASFGTPGGQVIAMSATGLFGDTMVAWLSAGTSLHFDFFNSTGSRTTGTNGFATTHAALAYFPCNPSGAGVFQRHAFLFDQSGANFTATWLTNTDGGVPGTWTSQVGSLPASFQGPTALHIGEVLVADTKRGGTLGAAVSGDVMVVILAGATIGTDAPMALKITSNGSGSAVTAVDVTANLPAPGPAFVVGGVDYDELNGLWGIVLYTAAAGTYFYTSPDFVTWTQVHHFPEYSGAQGGCAVAQRTWAVWVGANAALASDSNGRVLFSWNVAQKGAASTWVSAQGISTGPAANLPLGPCHLRSNGAQLLAGMGHDGGGAVKAAISHWCGFQVAGGVF